MNLEQTRINMVEQQIRPWDVFDKDVLDVFLTLKRENFVSSEYKNMALSDVEIPLPGGQKMLFPRVEARLLQELHLDRHDKVLEIGTGSGFVTAALAKLSAFVHSIEIDEANKNFATTNLMENRITNVSVILGNGISGVPAKAPYDKIFVGGALVSIPDSLKKQLKVGGTLVGFVGYKPVMHAVVLDKLSETEFRQRELFETDVDYLVGENSEHFKF